MVNRVGGALELIGLRAVILDIRQYANSGRQIEATNSSIEKATLKATAASDKYVSASERVKVANQASASAARQAINASRQFADNQAKLAQATNAVATAEAKLAAERQLAAQARPRDPETGRFLNRQQVAGRVAGAEQGLVNAKANVDSYTRTLAANQAAALAFGKAQRLAATDATKAAAETSRASALQVAANDRLAASQEKLVALQASRGRLVTGTAAVAGGLALAGTGAAAIGTAAKFEDTLAKIDLLTDATAEDVKRLGQEFITMSRTIPQTPDQLGASAYVILSSGIKDVNQALEVTRLSAKAAAIGLGESKDVARVITSTLNAYKGTGLEAAQVTDLLVAAVKEGSAEADDFAQSLGRVIPVASNLGVGFDELVATIAALTNAGLDASEATTGVLGILNQLQKSTPEAEEALASVGLTIEDIRRSIQEKGFVATMQTLAKAFSGNTSAIRPLLPEVRGLNAFVSAFIVQGNSASDILARIRNESGITDRAFEEMGKTFNFQKDLLKNQLNVALIQMGTVILPTVTNSLKELITWIDKNQESIKTFITTALQTAISVLQDFAAGIGAIIDALAWLPANEAVIVASVGAIGLAFSWALPGGPILKGLALMVSLMGALSKEGGFGDKAAQKLNDFFGLGSKAKRPLEPGDIRKQLEGQAGDIETAVRLLFKDVNKAFREELIEDMLKNLKAQGFDTAKGLEHFDAQMAKLNGTAKEGGQIVVPKIKRNVDELNTSAKELDKELKKLAQDFKSSSEAAGAVESVAQKLKLFGDVSAELADRLGLDAVSAGNVQAADAIIRAYERTAKEGFEYAKTLATVAGAYQMNAQVAKEIVLGLARSALEAQRAAAAAVLSRPTREVADLGVGLARSRQREAQVNQRVNPQLSALNKRFADLDRASRAIDKSQRAAEKQRENAERNRKKVQERQNAIMEAQLDALRLANLLARHAFERQQEQMQDLIDANRKSLSDLEKNFIKSNENLQMQINQAIGQGDSSKALNLVDQQRDATKVFRAQRRGLEDQNTLLEIQKKQAEREERERERQREVQEALLGQQQKLTKSQQELEESTDSVSEAYEEQRDQLEEQRQAIQDQIDALNAEKEVEAERTARIQEQIAVYEAETDVLRALVEASDKTLLTQQQQAKLIQQIIAQISTTSGIVRDLAGPFQNLIPEVQEATRQFNLVKDAARVLADEGFRSTLINTGIDPAAKRLEILGLAAEEAAKKTSAAALNQTKAFGEFGKSLAGMFDSLKKSLSGLNLKNLKIPSFDLGGLTSGSAPATGFLARLHPNELVLPLDDQRRTQGLLAKVGASGGGGGGTFAPIGPRGSYAGNIAPRDSYAMLPPSIIARGQPSSGLDSLFGDITVTGPTLEYTRSVVIREINAAFDRAGNLSSRSGGRISQGIGPNS